MIRHFTIIICAIILSLSANDAGAQRTNIIQGVVIDGHTGKPVENAVVRGGQYSTRTEANGRFELKTTRGEQLQVSHTNYQTRKISPKVYSRWETSEIYLSYSSKRVQNVLRAPYSETIYHSSFESVLDFIFAGDTLMVLNYMEAKPKIDEGGPRTYHNSLNLFVKGQLVQRMVLPDYVNGLYKDPFNKVYVLGRDFCYRVYNKYPKAVLKEIDNQYFEERIRLTTLVRDASSYFGVQLSPIPEVIHFVAFKDDENIHPIRNIRNEEYFANVTGDYELLNSSQKHYALELEEKYGIDQTLFAPLIRAVDFNRHYDYPFAPMYGDSVSVYIFDHLTGMVYMHEYSGARIDSVYMYHNTFDGEKYEGMLQDEMTKKCYGAYTKGGVMLLREIIPQTGAARQPIKIRNPFPRSVRIHDGWVYYGYKPTGSKETYKLLREKLSY